MQADDVEDISGYIYDGYGLVSIGNVLNLRYEVVDKLGHSDSATTWLCWVGGTAFSQKVAWVAVKGGREEDWAAAHVGMPIEEFSFEDMHGTHRCLVMPLLGRRLETLEWIDGPPLKKYLHETALALEYLHRHNVAHGQVAPRNIRFQLEIQDAHVRNPKEMKQVLGTEERIRRTAVQVPHLPPYRVRPADLGKLARTGRIVLYPHSGKPAKAVGIPDWYSAPEVLLRLTRDQPGGDVWSFCCTILDVYAKCSLGLAEVDSVDHYYDHVKILERFLGPLRPPLCYNMDDDGNELAEGGPRGRSCETEDEYEIWTLGRIFPPWTTPLKALLGSVRFRDELETHRALPEPEAEAVSTLLASALSYVESERSIQTVLESGWFADVGSNSSGHQVVGNAGSTSLGEDDAFKYVKKNAEEVDEQDPDVTYDEESLGPPESSQPQITKYANPLLELMPFEECCYDDILELFHITRHVMIPACGEFITRRQDPECPDRLPASMIEHEKKRLKEARKRRLDTKRGSIDHLLDLDPVNHRVLDHDDILALCQAYRDHGEWSLVRVRQHILRTYTETVYYDDKSALEIAMEKVNSVLFEYAKYRAERVVFYRRELPDAAATPLGQEMLREFPDLLGSELDLDELLPSPKPMLASSILTNEDARVARPSYGRSLTDRSFPIQKGPPLDELPPVKDACGSAEDDLPTDSPDQAVALNTSFSPKSSPGKLQKAIDMLKYRLPLAETQAEAYKTPLSASTESSPTDPSPDILRLLFPEAGNTSPASVVATEERRPTAREMETGTDTSGQEQLLPSSHGLIAPLQAASETPLPASADISLKSPGPDISKLFFTEANYKKVMVEAILDDVKTFLSTFESCLGRYLRKQMAKFIAGESTVLYMVAGFAAVILVFIVALFVAVLLRVRGSSLTTGESVASAAGGFETLEGRFRARVVSPYSELYEGLRKAGGNSTGRDIIFVVCGTTSRGPEVMAPVERRHD
ncbi:hypothetical protein PG994_008385 [Apiospora phragmitis]|uniref:non-specific serine/threonine protein kinase n=1 Tax=Apiospora phragmitis TaxID=2905665 RepID=A0ABR1USV2_9PEZI